MRQLLNHESDFSMRLAGRAVTLRALSEVAKLNEQG
jgi:hypothetical protein